MSDIQKKVHEVFVENFGKTPLQQRIQDIVRETTELSRFTDIQNLKEETGDSLASLLALCAESGWNFEELIEETLVKINRRKDQYKKLGRKTSVAVYGGSFDPIHDGHIETCLGILNQSSLFDEIWLMPCYKSLYGKNLSDDVHRLEMCGLAAQVDKRIKVCDWEIKNKIGGESYKIINMLQNEHKDTHDFSFVIGMDNANKAPTWSNWEHLERSVRFVIVARPGYDIKPENIWYLNPPHIFLQNVKTPDVSSTQIKKCLNIEAFRGDSLPLQICDKVYNYIINNELYKQK